MCSHRNSRGRIVLGLCACVLLTGVPVAGQVFTTIISVPSDPAPGSIGSDTQLNLFDTGVLGFGFQSGVLPSTNVEVNIFGGTVDNGFRAYSGSTVNISGGVVGGGFKAGRVGFDNPDLEVNITGGSVGGHFVAARGSTVNISGGVHGGTFTSYSDSSVVLIGGEFQLDGVPVAGLDLIGNSVGLNLPQGSVLSGTYADGTAFIYSSGNSDVLADGTLTLSAAAVPVAAPLVFNSPADDVPMGLRSGQTLNLSGGADLPDYFAAFDATLNVVGGGVGRDTEVANTSVSLTSGSVASGFRAYLGSTLDVSGGTVGPFASVQSGSTVNVSGGSVASFLGIGSGSTANISGGLVDSYLSVGSGGTVNISGGVVGLGVTAGPGGTVRISGGAVGRSFDAESGSVVEISGGTMGWSFKALTGSDVNLIGGEFQLDGVPVSGLNVAGDTVGLEVPGDSVLTGTLADGSVFIFGADGFHPGTLTLTAASIPAATPGIINMPADPLPLGLRQGQTLNLAAGGTLGNSFAAVGAEMNVSGGVIGENLEIYNSVLNMTGGSIGRESYAFAGSTVNLHGGSIDLLFKAETGSTVNVTGGTIGHSFAALSGSTVNISGGGVVEELEALIGSVVNISGGTVGQYSEAGNPFADDDTFAVVNMTGGVLGDRFAAYKGGVLNISGGTVGEYLSAYPGSEINVVGQAFMLDGIDLTGSLLAGIPLTITDRDIVLEGVLADGTPFSFGLNSSRHDPLLGIVGFFDPDATLTVSLVPEPISAIFLGVGMGGVLIRCRESGPRGR